MQNFIVSVSGGKSGGSANDGGENEKQKGDRGQEAWERACNMVASARGKSESEREGRKGDHALARDKVENAGERH